MKDLTKIDKPFGLLKPKVQKALKAHGGPYQWFNLKGWEGTEPGEFNPIITYRVAPQPETTPDQIDWSQLPVEFKLAACNPSDDAFAYTHRPLISADGFFTTEGRAFRISDLSLYTRGTCGWEDSLQERPE